MIDTSLDKNDQEQLVSLVRELVQIPSVNIESESSEPPERKLSEYLLNYLENLGMTVETLLTPGGRPNILAYWPEDNDKHKRLVLNAHMDTVDVEGMTVDPFAAEVRSGRIYGRGTCDTKGSMAVFLWILDKLRETKSELPFQVRFLATCDEENFCRGSKWLVDSGFCADQIIVGEPTNSQVAPMHRGAMIVEIETTGKSAHASVPGQGVNAIYSMLDLLEIVRCDWIPSITSADHKLLGSATAAVTVLRGGLRANMIPDRCRAVIDARILPGQECEKLIDDLKTRLDRVATEGDLNYSLRCKVAHQALGTDPACPLVKQLLAARKSLGLQAEVVGLPFLTDASNFARTTTDCVVFGPGNIEQAHCADEYLELDQLYLAAKILREFFRLG